MLNLREYRKKADRLTDLLPWALMIAPGILLNKDGSFQKTFRFRGPDLHSATKAELVSIAARLNNVFKRLQGGWAIYAEAQRVKSKGYPKSHFPEAVGYLIDEERRNHFEAGNHYESDYYLTLLYLPRQESRDRLENLIIERKNGCAKEDYRAHLKTFTIETERLFGLLSEIMPEAAPLNDEETLSYLHSCISPKRHALRVPEVPMYLDAFIADSPLVAGFEPRLGDHHLRTVSIVSYPGSSVPGILDSLNRLNFEYRWVTRFLPLDKEDAIAELSRYKKRWFSKRKGVVTMLKEIITQAESIMTDTDAVNKAADADMALQELSGDLVSYGYFTATVSVLDTDSQRAEKKARAIEKTINSLGFTAIYETMNAVEAWLGSLPGLCRANVRRPILNTLNLAHLLPVSAVWAGPQENTHLKGPVIMHTETAGNTPFRFNLHVGDVGHTMVIGPTGAGKDTLMGTVEVQFLRYPEAQVYIFDKGRSARVLTAGMGGDFYDLAKEEAGSLSFQPLSDIDDEQERAWASEWVLDILRAEKIEVGPDVKRAVWTALTSLSKSPQEQRTLSGFSFLIQEVGVRQAIEPYTLKGPFGRLFDASSDSLQYSRWQCFEMEELMNTPTAVPPTLSYLFHRLEKRFTGAPTCLVLNEAWRYLDNPVFEAKIREWLKALRKLNVLVMFATQSLSDIAESSIVSALIDSCPTQIFLPNDKALDERNTNVYRGFGLSDREIEILSLSTAKRHYYYKSKIGCRLFELALGPIAKAYCAATGKDDQDAANRILSEHGKEGFNAAWLKYKGLPWAADLYEGVANKNALEEKEEVQV